MLYPLSIIYDYIMFQTCRSYEKTYQDGDKRRKTFESTYVFDYIFEICTIGHTNNRL